MSQGYITNNTAQAGITTAYAVGQAIKLEAGDSAAITDTRSKALPQSGYLSHLTLVTDETGATAGTIEAFLTWDALGDEIFLGPTSAATVTAGMTDISLRMVSIKIDAWYTAPETQDAKQELYLFLKTDAGTVTLPIGGAKLHWRQGPNR
jgi:hypothetical protein